MPFVRSEVNCHIVAALKKVFSVLGDLKMYFIEISVVRECVRNLDLRVQVHPRELWVSKQRVHIVLEAPKSAGAKGDVPKICGFVHLLHPL